MELKIMSKYAAVILVAGKGTRMNEGLASPIPKVMFEMNGKPIIYWSVELMRKAGIEDICLIVGYKKEMIEEYYQNNVKYAVQEEQLGTGHAVMMAESLLKGKSESVVVSYGDSPLYKPETVQKLINQYETQKPTIAMLSVISDDPTGYGRIIREGESVKGIVEHKDCSEEQLKIKEWNPGFYIFDANWLWENISNLSNENAQKEYYITDLIEMAVSQDKKVIAMPVSEENEALGVNTLEQLKEAEEVIKARK